MTLFETLGNLLRPVEIIHLERGASKLFSETVKEALKKVLREQPDYTLYASATVYTLLEDYGGEKSLREGALFIYGTDWEPAVSALKKLKILVDGYCPLCGEKLTDEFWETMEGDYDREVSGFNYNRCVCGWNNLNKYL
jgi:hypothetical protein